MNFNPEAFMAATITAALDTRRTPCPIGEYPAVVQEYKLKHGEIKNGDRVGETWAGVEVTYSIEDPGVKALLGLPKVTSRQMIMMDLTPEGGLDISKGKNIQLGKFREACGENDAARPFAFGMTVGKHVIVKVGHRLDKDDPEIKYDEVTAVRRP